MKRVLVVYYSQTGQLRRVAEALCAPFADAEIELDWCALRPRPEYPFPWPLLRFFDQFPETVLLEPATIAPLGEIATRRYDLIIVAYTVWFLSPAPPVQAFLASEDGRRLLRDTPVVTLIACRNMWLLAQEIVKQKLADAGARLSDNIVLTDTGSSFATFVTTPRWMLTGRRDAFCGFPPAGLGDAQIAGAGRFGLALAAALQDDRLDGRRPVLRGLGAVQADMRLLPSERIGRRSFQLWGRLIRALGPQGAWLRKPALLVYAMFLVTMIVTVVPVTMLLRSLLRPLVARRLAAQKEYFEQPSGSAVELQGIAVND